MSDPNVDPGRPVPTITSSAPDTTGATDNDSAGQDSEDTVVAVPAPDYTVDPALKSAKGDTHAWSAELARMIGATTGTWIDPETFVPWFASFSDQVTTVTTRSIAFQVANTTIGDVFDDTADAGTLLLDLRTELVNQIRKRANLI